MIPGPGKRRFLGFKKAINDQRILLRRGPAAGAGSTAFHYSRAAIDCHAFRVGKNYVASVRDPFRIDRAMAGPQSRAVGTGAGLAFARPVHSDAREDRLLTRKKRRRA